MLAYGIATSFLQVFKKVTRLGRIFVNNSSRVMWLLVFLS